MQTYLIFRERVLFRKLLVGDGSSANFQIKITAATVPFFIISSSSSKSTFKLNKFFAQGYTRYWRKSANSSTFDARLY